VSNFKAFKKIVKNKKIITVVKGNAYGHGQNEVVKILEPYADCFQVNNISELELLRKVSKKKTFVFGYVQKHDLAKAIKLKCVLSIFSIEQLKSISAIAEMNNRVQEIHLSLDAHLGREGLLVDELPEFFRELKKYKFIKLTGIYAHFANIEDTDNFSHASKQINKFEEALALAEKFGFAKLQNHISATSGILVYENKKGSIDTKNYFVRLGLGLYGMWPSENIKYLYTKTNKNNFKLKPILSWKTKIAQIKNLPKGSTVGYGLTYTTKKETKIAVIPQGYADGIDRGLSNKGEVLIQGKRSKILGRVAMNMFVVDISHLKNVKREDEVVIIGSQNKGNISAEEIADKLGTINYEVTTRISALLPRIIK
jgi:alanine racemase